MLQQLRLILKNRNVLNKINSINEFNLIGFVFILKLRFIY